MCFVDGSPESAVAACPFCKLSKPRMGCPHKPMVTCRNRTLHPRHDVVYLSNVPLETFKGCGYCKWAKTSPPPSKAGFNNIGWPGCCRPPESNEYHLIPRTEWNHVGFIHGVQTPKLHRVALPGSPPSTTSGSPPHATTRPLHTLTPRTKSGGTGGSGSLLAPPHKQPPKTDYAAYAYDDEIYGRRRSSVVSVEDTTPQKSRKDSGKFFVPPSSAELDAALAVRRAAQSSTRSTSSDSPKSTQSKLESTAIPKATLPPNGRPARSPSDRACEFSDGSSNSSRKSGGSSRSGSTTDSGTVISEGFTDYLSDESEAELQRLAEEEAARMALKRLDEQQRRNEEMEFKLARERLASIDLQPPMAPMATTWSASSSQF